MCFSKKNSQVAAPAPNPSPDGNKDRIVDRYAIKKANKPELKESDESRKYSNITQTGPMENRKCTDILCCLIFLVFTALNGWITVYSFTKGDPYALAQPYDIDNNACGTSNSPTTPFKYAYFFNPISDLTSTICIEKCPSWTTGSAVPNTLGQCYIGKAAQIQGGRQVTGVQECNQALYLDFGMSDAAINTFIGLNTGRLFIYNTQPLLDRFCVPDMTGLPDSAKSYYNKIVKGTQGENYLEEAFSDIRNTWGIILASAGGAFVICILYMFVLRWCVGIFIWLMILTFFALLVVFAIFFHRKANYYDELYVQTLSQTFKDSYKKFFWTAVVFDFLIGILFCVLCCYMRTIELCIAVLKSAALFMANNFLIIFVPVVMAVILVFYAVFWAWVMIHVWSIGTYTKGSFLPVGQVTWNSQTRAFVYIHMFSLLWNGCFILYYGQFVIILATCLWYFDHHPKTGKPIKGGVIRKALGWALFKHLGTIAFAALILAIIIFLRIILYYIQQQVMKLQDKANKEASCLLKCVFGCLHAFLACAHRVIKIVNKSGFVTVALKSQNFCVSCLEGFTLLLRNPMKFGVLAVLGEFFIFLGKIFVGIVTAFIGYLIITRTDRYNKVIYSPYVPTFFFFLNGIIVGAIFMSVYGLSADAIMFCYFVEKNSNVSEDSLRCPDPMKKFFLSNKSSDSEDEKRRAQGQNPTGEADTKKQDLEPGKVVELGSK